MELYGRTLKISAKKPTTKVSFREWDKSWSNKGGFHLCVLLKISFPRSTILTTKTKLTEHV